jgi:hypothetical protein
VGENQKTMAKKKAKRAGGVRKKTSVRAHTKTSKKTGRQYTVRGHTREYMAALKKRRAEALAYFRKHPVKVGARKGQTKHYGPAEARAYVKAGKVHVQDVPLDESKRAEHVRKPGQPTWRGDLPGPRHV